MKLRTYCVSGTVLVSAVIASPSSAHMTLWQQEAASGSYYKVVMQAPHGCQGSPTVRIRIQIPDGVTGVKPQPKPGWQLSIVKKPYNPPIIDHGRTITEGVGEVIWSGGKLLDEHFDEFLMSVKLPEKPAGTVIYFPSIQECEIGAHRWIEIPAAGKTRSDYKEPAPQLTLVAPRR